MFLAGRLYQRIDTRARHGGKQQPTGSRACRWLSAERIGLDLGQRSWVALRRGRGFREEPSARLIVDPATRDISGGSRPGQPAAALTASEQSAFCRVAAGAAEAVINRQLSTRRAGQPGWALDQLTAHHELPSSGASLI